MIPSIFDWLLIILDGSFVVFSILATIWAILVNKKLRELYDLVSKKKKEDLK